MGLVGPLAVVVLSIILVLGVMGAFGWVLGLLNGIVPTLLCAVGVAQSVHIILEFQRVFGETGNKTFCTMGMGRWWCCMLRYDNGLGYGDKVPI